MVNLYYFYVGSVSGTPTYFLNDVPIAAEPTWTLDDWKTVIDPLLTGKTESLIFEPTHNKVLTFINLSANSADNKLMLFLRIFTRKSRL